MLRKGLGRKGKGQQMSAFVVSRAHVDALVATAVFGPTGVVIRPDHAWYGVHDPDTRDTLTYEDADRIGAELWAENVRSVQYRYGDPNDLPGPLDFTPEDAAIYRFPMTSRPLTPAAGLKAAHCLEYQSCEHPGWEASWSRRFLEALRDSLERRVEGYADADWEVKHPVRTF